MADKIKMEVLIMDSMISKFRAIGDRSNNIINRLRQIENGVKNSYIADSSIKIQGNIDDVLKSGREVTETLYKLSIQLNSAKDAIIRADKDSYNNIKLNTIIRGKEDFSKVKDSKDTISNMEKVIGYFGLGAMVSISDNLALNIPNLTGLYNDKRLRYNLENENRYGVLAAYQYGKTFGDIEGLAQGTVELFGGLSIMGFGGLGAGALTVATDGAAAPAVPLVESAGIAVAEHGIGMASSSLYNMGSDFSKGNFYFSEMNKGTGNPVYKPSPKHDPTSGWGSPDPIPDIETGQEVLNTAYSSSKTKQLYNYYDGKLVKFQPDTVNGWHSYEVVNPAKEVPADVLRQMLNDGKITKVQYKNFIKNK